MGRFALVAALIAALSGCAEAEPSPETAEAGNAPRGEEPAQGRSIGTVTVHGELAVLELDEGVIAEANPFDLEGRTLRFTPDGAGYRVENLPLAWDPDYGPELDGGRVTLNGFAFPFSGADRTSLDVGTGTIVFPPPEPEGEGGEEAAGGRGGRGGGGPGGRGRGLPVGRFDELREAAPEAEGTVPAISVFLKPRLRGDRHVKELEDRLVVTWDLSQPVGGIQDFTFVATTERFQAVLHRDGRIDLSWDELGASDAIVGIYSVPAGGAPPAGPVDLSELSPSDPPSPVLYEAFHHYGRPETASMACTVIRALGDRFDFMVWYSDFRVDQQEAGTPSTGGIGDAVTGLGRFGPARRQPRHFCSDGRLQATYIQPVFVGSNQAMERAPDASWDNYDYAMSQIPHELGHRWAARARAIVAGDTIDLGPTHWGMGVHVPVPYPYSGEPEASMMGGGHWQENDDGTFTRLADNYYVPASGYSYLDLYLMGLIPASEVPDFFVLQDAERTGEDGDGHPVYTATRIPITIDDVIAYNGPRMPPYGEAQTEYSTAVVAVVLPGRSPSPALLERLEGIRRAWVDFFARTTGGTASMSTSLREE